MSCKSAIASDLSRISDVVDSVCRSADWKKLLQIFTESREVFFIGNGGNLSILTHLVSDLKRSNILKRYMIPNEVVHFSNMVRESGSERMFEHWLSLETTLTENPLLLTVASGGQSHAIIHALQSSCARKFSKVFITFDQPRLNIADCIHINLGLETYHCGEIALLALGYQLIASQGAKMKTISL